MLRKHTMAEGDPRSARTVAGAAGLVVLFLTGLALIPRMLAWRQSSLLGQEGPEFALALVANGATLGGDGSVVTLGDLRGRAVLLDFWATWCPPCRAEAPIVDKISRRWRDRGVVVVGVDTDAADQGDPREFAVAHGLTYPIVRDLSGEASRSYEIESLPTLVLISPAGRVVAIRTGITDDAEIERLLQRALD